MRRTSLALACAVSFTAPALVSRDAPGGVVPLSRTSTIDVDGVAEDDSFDEGDSTNAFGPYSNIVTGSAGATDGTRSSASADQLSNVNTSTAGRLTGTFNTEVDAFAAFDPEDVSGPLMAQAVSELTVLFEVTSQPEPYRVNGLLAGTLGTVRISLTNTTDAANPVTVFSIFNDDEFTPPEFDENGDLAPGSYRLLASARAASSGSGPADPHSFGSSAQVNLDFAFGVADEPVIPLPPAVWTGASGLIIAAGAMAIDRRRRARA